MILAIWGKDGIGKSTLAHKLGAFFAAHELTGVVNTDLTMPTLPLWMPKAVSNSGSLGRFITGTGTSEIRPYLHHHPQQEGLFYSGLSYEDDFLTYEVGLEADEAARRFINQCTHVLDHVILDLSGQRNDPFLLPALQMSDRVLVCMTADLSGLCWFNAISPLLHHLSVDGRVVPIAMQVQKGQDPAAIERSANLHFHWVLPFVREFPLLYGTGDMEDISKEALRWSNAVKKLGKQLKTCSEMEGEKRRMKCNEPYAPCHGLWTATKRNG